MVFNEEKHIVNIMVSAKGKAKAPKADMKTGLKPSYIIGRILLISIFGTERQIVTKKIKDTTNRIKNSAHRPSTSIPAFVTQLIKGIRNRGTIQAGVSGKTTLLVNSK